MHYLANEKTPEDTNTMVIYLHGFPDTCWLWEQQLRSGLSSKAHLIALDLPGCGGSDSHSFYGPDEILNAVAEAIVQLKNRYLKDSSISGSLQRAVLVSHDWYLHYLPLPVVTSMLTCLEPQGWSHRFPSCRRNVRISR